jgi:hypothetical protein
VLGAEIVGVTDDEERRRLEIRTASAVQPSDDQSSSQTSAHQGRPLNGIGRNPDVGLVTTPYRCDRAARLQLGLEQMFEMARIRIPGRS